MRVFKTKAFVRIARKEGISDETLREAVRRAQSGLVDADLGGGVIKQRVARPGQGRSGGFRTLIAFSDGKISVFLYAFPKSDRDNIDKDELASLREIAKAWFEADSKALAKALKDGVVKEIKYDESESKKD